MSQIMIINCSSAGYKNAKRDLGLIKGPVILRHDGAEEWFQNGILHREDGPAVIFTNGTCEWWQNGILHREDGPALECKDIDGSWTYAWYQNGICHRLDGPAIEYSDCDGEWYINGINITAQIMTWLEEQNITLPFTDAEQSMFIMKFYRE